MSTVRNVISVRITYPYDAGVLELHTDFYEIPIQGIFILVNDILMKIDDVVYDASNRRYVVKALIA